MATEDNQESGRKGYGIGFYIAVTVLLILPGIAIIVWYVLPVTDAEKATAELLEQARVAAIAIAERAAAEGFLVDDFDECGKLGDHFKTGVGIDLSQKARRRLLGLSTKASADQELERCVVFAKVVSAMERLAHHDRHTFVCQGAEIVSEDGAYKIRPEENGRGVIELDVGAKRFIPIPKYKHILIEGWQLFNMGDGCLVAGMSRVNNFSYSGTIRVVE